MSPEDKPQTPRDDALKSIRSAKYKLMDAGTPTREVVLSQIATAQAILHLADVVAELRDELRERPNS